MSNIDYYYSQGFAKWPSKLTSIRKEFSLITTTITAIGSIQLLFLITPGHSNSPHIPYDQQTRDPLQSSLSHKGYL